MKLDDLKGKKELIGVAMLAVSALSTVLIATKVTGHYLASANASDAVNQAIEQSRPDDENVTAQLAKSRKVADALKKQNLFSPPAPRRHPVAAVIGIFGQEALINGRWYKAGANVADAKVLAVDATSVTIEWDGKTKVFCPIDGGSSSGPSGSGRPTFASRGSSPSKAGGAQMVVTNSLATGKSAELDKDAAKAMEKARKKMMEQAHKNMSDGQKAMFKRAMEAHRGQYEQMSGDEKTRFKAGMMKRIGQSGGRITMELKSK